MDVISDEALLFLNNIEWVPLSQSQGLKIGDLCSLALDGTLQPLLNIFAKDDVTLSRALLILSGLDQTVGLCSTCPRVTWLPLFKREVIYLNRAAGGAYRPKTIRTTWKFPFEQ